MIIAVDFDGTLCNDSQFPAIGEPKQEVIDWVIKQKQLGHKIVMWTCREGDILLEAVHWCIAKNIQFDAINENVPETKFGYLGKAKIIADIYLDDKSGNVQDVVKRYSNAIDFVRG